MAIPPLNPCIGQGASFSFAGTEILYSNLGGHGPLHPKGARLVPEALRQRTYLDAIKPFSGLTHTLASPMAEAINSANLDNSNNYVNYGNHCYGIGARYDNLNVGSGANFQMNPFSQRIRSLLDGRGNVSIYTFMIHKNMLVLNNQVGAMVEN